MFIGEMLYPVDGLCLAGARARAGEAPAAAGLQELPLAQKQRLHHLSLYGENKLYFVLETRMIVEGTRGPFYTIGRFSFRALIL